ncbi:MAG: hypothetical protein ACFFD2_06155 [Promethearchaeota archaeon]
MTEKPKEELTDEEHAVLMEVVNSGDKGIFPETIAKKLKMPIEKVEKILNNFEEEGWFYSEEIDE